ncbi:MAG: hypothetical protein ACYDB9_01725 [Gammaproteobacteria bacterium]
MGESLQKLLYGKFDRIGLSGANFVVNDLDGKPQSSRSIGGAAVGRLMRTAQVAEIIEVTLQVCCFPRRVMGV